MSVAGSPGTQAQEAPAVEASEALLIGAWDVDQDAFLAGFASQVSAEELALMQQFQMRVVWRADGSATLSATGLGPDYDNTIQATWATVTASGPALTVLLLEPAAEGEAAAPQTYTLTFETPDRFWMVGADDPTRVPFVRGTLRPGDEAVAASEVPAPAPAAPADLPAPHPITGAPVTEATMEHLHGSWNADIAELLAAEAATMSPEETAMMVQLMGSMEIVFTFAPDGSASMRMTGMGQAETESGTWQLLSSSGNTVRFTLTEDPVEGSAMPVPEVFTATFLSENNLTLAVEGDPQIIPFYRH